MLVYSGHSYLKDFNYLFALLSSCQINFTDSIELFCPAYLSKTSFKQSRFVYLKCDFEHLIDFFFSFQSESSSSSVYDLRIKAKRHQESLGIRDLDQDWHPFVHFNIL